MRSLDNNLERKVSSVPRAKQRPQDKAIDLLRQAFEADPNYYECWLANVAVAIYDTWPARGKKIDKCYRCAAVIAKRVLAARAATAAEMEAAASTHA